MAGNIKKDRFSVFQKILYKVFCPILSDHLYAKLTMSRWFENSDIDSPTTFNEKLQWLKLNDRQALYSDLADKYKAKNIVSNIIGDKYIIKTHMSFDSVDELNVISLPTKFVLKTNNSSGGNIIVKNKATIDFNEVKVKLNSWMKQNYYNKGREWVYRDIKKKIICEELLSDESGDIPYDFKFFCFHGVPKYIQVDIDRFSEHKRVFYDVNWVKQPFNTLYEYCELEIEKPKRLDEMLEIASKLSSKIVFCRVDLYSTPNVFFGEITFYPENGIGPFTLPEWDLKFGSLINLPK